MLAWSFSSPAHAQYAVHDSLVYQHLVQFQTSIIAKLTAMEASIVGAINKQAQVEATQQARSAELVSDGAQRTASVMEQQRNEARYEHPDKCGVLAATSGAEESSRSGVGKGSGGASGGGGSKRRGGVNDNMNKAIDIAERRVEPPSPEVQAALASSGACSAFASTSADVVRGASCIDAGYQASASSGFPDADIRAETLFDGPQRGATSKDFRRRLTVDSEDKDVERTAMDAYLRNLSIPVDLRQLRKAELQTDAGRQYMAYRDSFSARMAVADKAVRVMSDNRMADPRYLPVVNQLLSSEVTGAYAQKYLDDNYKKWKTRGISTDEFYNLEASRRYLNKDWHVKMAGLSPDAHTKEQTNLMALQIVMLNRITEKLDLIAVTSGQTMGTQVRQEMMPQLVALHGRASR